MPFRQIGYLAFENAEVTYRTLGGESYELPGTYQGAYPGATRDSQTLELDSAAITIAGSPTPQQMSLQLPASDHPAARDMFAAQTDGSPRNITVKLQPRTLYTKPSGSTVQVAVANGAITVSGTQRAEISPEIVPVNAAFVVAGQGGSEDHRLITGGEYSRSAGTGLTSDGENLSAIDIIRIVVPGLQFGPFLANVDEIGLIDDTGVGIYRFAFTPVNVVPAPSEQLT